MKISISAILFASLFAVDAAKDEAVKKDLAKLQGTWRVVAVEENGEQVPEDKIRESNVTVTIEGDKHTLRLPGKTLGPVTITLDPTAKPKHYDMKIPEDAKDPNAGKTLHGIYELNDDTWKFCQDKSGKGRPSEFSGKSAPGWVYVIMKKEKK